MSAPTSSTLKLLAAAVVLLPFPAAAQDAPGRAAVAAFADSLAAISDAAALAPLAALPANRPAGHDAMRHLRRGLVLLRQGELAGGRDALDDAIRAFDEATIHAPDWPWPFVGLARARIALRERGAVVKPSRHQPLGEHYEDAAARDLARALELDSTFTPAAHLMAVLLADSPGDFPVVLHRAVRAAAAVPEHGPGMQLLLARLERHLRNDAAAVAALERYEAAGGDPGVAALERARTYSQMGRRGDAVRSYLAGLRVAGPAGRAAYRADLAYVATAPELAAFDSLAAGGTDGAKGDAAVTDPLADWHEAFWRRRDAAALREPGERVAEHLRRWLYATGEFRVPNRYWDTEGARTAARRDDIYGESFADMSAEFNELALATTLTVAPIGGRAGQGHRIVDDRGFMYVRHGEPRARVHCAGGGGLGAPPTTSWVYTVPEGTWIVHFARGRFTATPSLATEPLGMGARGQGTMQVSSCLNRLAAADPRFGILAMEREGRSAMQMLKALSAAMLGGDPRELYSPDRSVNHVVQLAARDRATAERALRTDTYPLHFEEDLAPVIQLHAVGTPASGATGVLAVFAVPGDRLTPGPAAPDGRTTYPLRIRLVAADTGGRAMHTVDTLRTFAVRGALGKGSWLNGIVELPLPPGAYDVRMLVTQPDTERGGAGGRLGVVIPSGAAALTMSDVVAGDARSGLVWRSHGAAVPLNPLGVFRRDAAVELYYELGGLRPGTGYRTMIEIGRGDAATDRVTVSFSETAESRVARVARSIGVQALPGGRYVLRVTVTEDGTGREVVHERWLDIRPGDPR